MQIRTFFRQLDMRRRANSIGLMQRILELLIKDKNLLPHHIPKTEVKKILVLRNNKRIGNMYFMLPFLHALRQSYPDATINLMVINKSQSDIFKHINLDNVFISHFSLGSISAFFQSIKESRTTVYDIILMPNRSDSDTLIGALLSAKNKVAFQDQKSNRIYPHSLDAVADSRHVAISPLKLIEALGNKLTAPIDHTMRLSPEEIVNGNDAAQGLKGTASLCFAYFRGARGNKVLADSEWIKILQEFEKASSKPIKWVEILSPDVHEPLRPETSTFAFSNLRNLAATLAALDLFICSDTGPLHLADAANSRCAGIFTATNPDIFGCLDPKSVNIIYPNKFHPKDVLRQLGLI